LVRRSPLVSRTGLVRRTPLRQVSVKRAAASGRPARPRDTGPDRTTRGLVLERDDWRCFCCGAVVLGQPHNLQHRDARGMGGTSDPAANSPANLITLAGTPITGCHGRVEKRGAADNDRGYWLKNGQAPEDTRVWLWRLGWVLLGDDGEVTPLRGAV
jgi:hypothetical protein